MRLELIERALYAGALAADVAYSRRAIGGRAWSIASWHALRAARRSIGSLEFIVDAGANVGQFAVAANRWFPEARILCFEPVEPSYLQLQHNTRRLPQITTSPLALGKHEGETTILVNQNSQVSSMLHIDSANSHPGYSHGVETARTVRLTTLDAALDQLSFGQPAMLKLDVQGYESAVLAGASRSLPRFDWLICEMPFEALYEGQDSFSDLYELITGAGYSVAGALSLNYGSGGKVIEADLLFRRTSPT